MRKVLLLWILIFGIFIPSVYGTEIPPLPAETEKEYETNMTLPVDKLVKGDIVYADIELNEAAEVYAFETKVEFDVSFLEYKSVSVSDKSDDDILIEKQDNGELLIAYSQKGKAAAEKRKKICTIEFASLKSGETAIHMNSVKLVFGNMTYFADSDNQSALDINIRAKVQTSGSGGGGGGSARPSGSGSSSSRGGMTVSGGGVTSSGVSIPAEPIVPVIDEKETKVFSDIDNSHWAYEAVCAMADVGIICGFEDGSFRPESNITRAEFTKIIMSGEELNSDNEVIFSDVDVSDWYYPYITTAANTEIVTGKGDGIFAPDDYITREEAAVIMMRFGTYKGYNMTPVRLNINFADEADISDFAVGSIDALYTCGVLSGSDDGKFYPLSYISRAEAAAAVYNLIGLSGKEN